MPERDAGIKTFLIADVRGYTAFTDDRGDEAAARLRCSPKTLDGYVASGALKYVALGHGTERQRRMFTGNLLTVFDAYDSEQDAISNFVPQATA